MQDLIIKLKQEITELASDEAFIHHEWFVDHHLKIVERLALELGEHYPEADRDTVLAMCWMHDYGKIIDFDNQYEATADKGVDFLMELGFDAGFSEVVIDGIEQLDRKDADELSDEASIEVQIVSSADGCSHFLASFNEIYWRENPDQSIQELVKNNIWKATVDWEQKIVLQVARDAFESRYKLFLERKGILPEKFFS